ncbi:MAG: hypothetical protein JXP34_01410 [Planctomycetes bacterium]|nr:hypothetical protein [Planctomycetota bacterium]
MVVDSNHNLVVVAKHVGGRWPSAPFAEGFQASPREGIDKVVIKISSDGSRVLWATYLGGSKDEGDGGIAIDASDHVYVATSTRSPDMPTTAGAADTTFNGGIDLHVAKVSPDGQRLIFGTYVGTSGEEGLAKSGIRVDGAGDVLFVAYTTSSDFPTTARVAHSRPVESSRVTAVVVRLSPRGDLLAASYTGHRGSAEDVDCDAAGNIYTIGATSLRTLPVSPGAFQTALGGGSDDGYAEVFSNDLTRVIYTTYLGGSGDDSARMVWVDPASHGFYIFGTTTSGDFPTRNALHPKYAGGGDIFITRIALEATRRED